MKKNILIVVLGLVLAASLLVNDSQSRKIKSLELTIRSTQDSIITISPAEAFEMSKGIDPKCCSADTIKLGGPLHITSTPQISFSHEMYQLWIVDSFYVLKDRDRVVWKDKVGSGSDIDHIVIQDNL